MADFLRIAAVVREPLQVGDQDKLLVVMLQRDALAQRADVVAKMKLAGRAVAGEDGLWREKYIFSATRSLFWNNKLCCIFFVKKLTPQDYSIIIHIYS